MFKSRKFRIRNRHALDKRKLKENYYHFASELSEVGSDSIKRRQFDLSMFKPSAFIEFNGVSADTGIRTKLITGDVGTVVASIESIKSFEVEGDYTVSWNMDLAWSSGDGRFISCTPFIGSRMIPSAEDSFYEFGFINNMTSVTCEIRSKNQYNPRRKADSVPREATDENWDNYGKMWMQKRGELFDTAKAFKGVQSQVRKTQKELGAVIHLSGIGCVNMPRSSSSLGLLVHCQGGSAFVVQSATLNIRKRRR